MYQRYCQIDATLDVQARMESQEDFQESRKNLLKDDLNMSQKTIVINIEGTLITRVEEDITESSREYVVVEGQVFKINPETYNFIYSIAPFFEIVCFTNLPDRILSPIINHIEEIMNLPLIQSNSQKENSRQRNAAVEEPKIFFNFIIDEVWYHQIGDIKIENLMLLTFNREKNEIIYLSNDPLRVVAAMKQGFLTIPVENKLNVLESYLIRNRNLKNMAKTLQKDFSKILHN